MRDVINSVVRKHDRGEVVGLEARQMSGVDFSDVDPWIPSPRRCHHRLGVVAPGVVGAHLQQPRSCAAAPDAQIENRLSMNLLLQALEKELLDGLESPDE